MQCQNNLNAKYICMIYNLITKVYSDELYKAENLIPLLREALIVPNTAYELFFFNAKDFTFYLSSTWNN